MAKMLKGAVPTSFAESLEEAVLLARGKAKRGDVVLLSPACASFDMFRDYAHRGDVFKEVVSALRSHAKRGAKDEKALK